MKSLIDQLVKYSAGADHVTETGWQFYNVGLAQDIGPFKAGTVVDALLLSFEEPCNIEDCNGNKLYEFELTIAQGTKPAA